MFDKNLDDSLLPDLISHKNNALELLENIIKYSPDWIYWKDKNSVHLGSNDQFAKAAGFSSHKEMIGKTDHLFPWRDRADKYRLDDQEVIQSGVPKLNIEDKVVIHNGAEVTVISNKVPLRNSKGQVIGVLGIATDITHLKKTEENLTQAMLKAEAASRAKTEFIANMGHDIRTPLTGIIGMSSILEDEVKDPTEKEHAMMIHQSGDQLLGLLNGVLDLITVDATNEEMVQHESFDVRQVIREVTELEHSAVETKHLTINTQVDEAIPPYVVGDKMKLHRIMLNLVGNAVKFTKDGHIDINAKLQSIEGENAKILFSVKDTGIGIPSALQDKVFDRFFKVSPSYKGLYTGNGIGLHIAQKYVELMGGDIQLASAEGSGTTFSFILSMKIGAPPSEKKAPAPITNSLSPAINPNQLHVLLVEDNVTALNVLKILVKKYNVQVSTAVDAEVALTLLKKQIFDLIITDLGLPGQSGEEMTAVIRAYEREHHLKPMKIVGLTGHALGEITDACLRAGMNEVYRKPMLPDTLKKLMEEVGRASQEAGVEKPKSGGRLGMDLPDTEAQLFEIDAYPLLDLKLGAQILGDESLLHDLYKELKTHGITADLAIIQKAHQNSDWKTVEKYTHKIKGGACYGTVRLYYALLYMERYLKAGHSHCSEALYAQMLRVIDETMAYLEKWLEGA